MHPVSPDKAPGNRLLAAMTRAERSLVLGAARPVALPAGSTVFSTGEVVRQVLFPDSGLVSLLADLPDAEPVEVGLIGREGLVGLPALLGDPTASLRAVVQVGLRGQQLEAATLLLLTDGSRNLRNLLRQYTMAMLVHTARCAACNAAHPLEKRAARWLLSVADRVGPNIPITQDDLATMIGARRPTVNLVLRDLRRAGLIRHARGQVAIADRAALEEAACPCYRLIREAHDRLFPGAFRSSAPA